ncbi:MFS transporter [Marinicrinis sediminis]|uniref:MFS transporter n=1 Tax=Marinicrinis sediminis TaxID=1652465 RepID=A0ABW5R786_9BACL
MEANLSMQPNRQVLSHPSLWKNKTFKWILLGYIFSVLGDRFHSVAISFWVLKETGSARLMSIVLLIHISMSLFFGAFAGTIADRTDRRKLMYRMDFIRVLFVVGIACMLLFPFQEFRFGVIILLISLTAFAGLFQAPASQASLINIVGKDQIQKATGALSFADNIAGITGLSMAGFVVAALGGASAIFIDALTFLISGLCVLAAGKFPSPIHQNKERKSFLSDLKEGIQYIFKNRFVRCVALINPLLILFYLTSLLLIQVLAVKEWRVSSIEFGMLEACVPLGYMLGAFMIMRIDQRLRKRGWLILGSMALLGPLFIAISFVQSVWVGLFFVLCHGFIFSYCTLLVMVIIRLKVEESIQGRVFATLGSITSVVPPLGLIIAPFFADAYSASSVLGVTGILFFIVALCFLLWLKPVRQFE